MPVKSSFKERFGPKLEEYLECLELEEVDRVSLEQIVYECLEGKEKPADFLKKDAHPQDTDVVQQVVYEILGVNIYNPGTPFKANVPFAGTEGEPSEGGGIGNMYRTGRGYYLWVIKYKNPEAGTQFDLVANPELDI